MNVTRKWFFLTLFALQGFSEEVPCLDRGKIRPLVEFKAGYFFFSDKIMRKVYEDGGIDFQISGSYPIWKWLQIYGSAEYLERRGKSLGDLERTNIWEIPLNLGLKPVLRITEKLDYYLTVGPRYVFAHVHNDSSFVPHNVRQSGLGGFVGTGFNYFPYKNLVIDLFGEYSYVRMHFHPHKTNVFGRGTQVGGFTFGGGLGHHF